jgi:hypothetical protein
MAPVELEKWASLIKDALLSLGAIVTMCVALYGLRMWKRELAGKEVFAAAKILVRESHLLTKSAQKARSPVWNLERRSFSEAEVQNTTKNERWRLSEAEAFKKNIDELSAANDSYRSALLDARVLLGSRVYGAFLPFDKSIGEVINRIGNYIRLLQNHSLIVLPDSLEVVELQSKLYPSEHLDDDLSQLLSNCREQGEVTLLGFLHRKEISA